jgi:hypothetical protein
MQKILIILLAIGFVFTVFAGHYLWDEFWKMESVRKILSIASDNLLGPPEPSKPLAVTADVSQAAIQSSSFSIDTSITAGPKSYEIITDSNQVTFEFKGTVYPASTKYFMNFETKVDGLDSKWQQTSNTKRTITAKPGFYKYTFWVRTKFGSYVDKTPAKRTFYVKISPSFGKVKINSASHQSIILRSQLSSASERINITGWQIKAQRGKITIPRGIELFAPGTSLLDNDIFIKQSDQITIFSAHNPFNVSKGLRSNKCFGYLKDNYTSWPSSLPADSKICPKIDREKIGHLSKSCQDAIFVLEGCKPLDYSRYPQIYSDSSCQDYAQTYTSSYLNYNGCIQNYYKDKDFLKNYWYIYASYDIVCNCNEYMYLYDKSGLLVDKYYYRM